MESKQSQNANNNYGFLSGGGELGNLIRSFDWSTTSIGAVEYWPQSLRSALSICLNSNFPIAIYWGKDLTLLYNDAWKLIPGNKHPGALGLTAKEVWPEIWDDLAPQFDKTFSGLPGGSKDALLPMQRHGYTEECYFDFTFTPIYGEEGKVEGVFNAVIETTYRVINERRAALLKKLPHALARVATRNQVHKLTIDAIKEFSKDIPFAFLYTIDQDGYHFSVSTDNHIALKELWVKDLPANELIHSGNPVHVSNLKNYMRTIPYGSWPEVPVEGLMVPLKDGKGEVDGFLFCGLSARLGYDDEYKVFIENIASSVMSAVHNIASLENERKRSEDLLELDRAKTAFFTNISHEFRTPLTLLLGPVQQFLSNPTLPESTREQIEPVYRNALRMQKLVNTLLEFSRIEAGRVEAHYVPVDIGKITADLASTFRSAIENAGMELHVDLSPVSGEVYVDPNMWEKIILNLLSNAFKYTFKGVVKISVKQVGTDVQVAVSDTGIGVPADQLDKLFDRFHRIENAGGRSLEGTGIGLALVKELIALHSGTIAVESELKKGSTFTISIPTGRAHLPADKIVDSPIFSTTSQLGYAYREEALSWTQNVEKKHLSEQTTHTMKPSSLPENTYRHKVLVADDNPDMRDYIKRLLADQFTVITAQDGAEAYSKMLEHTPDLLISDIMMPVLDGYGLLNKVRSHPELKATPVMFLSARAGEEAKVEGLDAGADDYLVKPFSAKELVVRASNHIRINQVRRETEQQFYQLFLQAPALINVFKGADHVYEIFHPKNKEIFGDVDFTGKKLIEALPELENQGILTMLNEVYQEGKVIVQNQIPITFFTDNGKVDKRYFNLTYQPWYDIRGKINGVLNFAVDITAQVHSQRLIEKSERQLRNIIMQAPVPMCIFRGDTFQVETANVRMLEFWGKSKLEVGNKPVMEVIPEIVEQGFDRLLSHVFETGERYSEEERPVVLTRNGVEERHYVNFVYEALREENNEITSIMAVMIDVTEQVLARQKIEEAEEKARLAIESADLGTYEVNLLTNELKTSRRFNEIWGVRGTELREKMIERIHPDDQMIRLKAHELSRSTGYLDYETRILRDDHSVRWIKVKGALTYDSHGVAMVLLGVIQDITEQKQFSEQLSLQVNERTQQLKRSNEDLQQFAHVASHDLREPVRKIKLYSNRLESDYGHSMPEKGRGFIDKIQQSTDRIFSMIEGVLAYSSFNATEHKTERINLNEIITAIEVDMEVVMSQKNAVIERGELPEIEGAPVLIYQLFYNLVNNSLKFSRTDIPPVISIYTPVANGKNNFVTIIVADNGIGFEQQYGERIFETFTRLNRKDEYEGTGLGLSLCKKIVERHHGKIGVEGEVNKGAKFTISLPLTRN